MKLTKKKLMNIIRESLNEYGDNMETFDSTSEKVSSAEFARMAEAEVNQILTKLKPLYTSAKQGGKMPIDVQARILGTGFEHYDQLQKFTIGGPGIGKGADLEGWELMLLVARLLSNLNTQRNF